VAQHGDAHRQKLERVQVAFLSIEMRVVLGSNWRSRGISAWWPRTISRSLALSPAMFPRAHTACKQVVHKPSTTFSNPCTCTCAQVQWTTHHDQISFISTKHGENEMMKTLIKCGIYFYCSISRVRGHLKHRESAHENLGMGDGMHIYTRIPAL
jgi:hypothetical protein